MSSFFCERCGAHVIDKDGVGYVAGCRHYPVETGMAKNDASGIEISGIIQRQTGQAVLFSDGIIEEWLPKSLIIATERHANGLVDLTIPDWLAIERGFV